MNSIQIKRIAFICCILFSSLAQAQITFTFPKLSGEVGKKILYPIKITDLTGLNVSAYQFQINYDPSIIHIYDTAVLGTLSNYSKTTNYIDTTNGIIRIAWASPDPIIGEGILLNLKIQLLQTGSAKINYSTTGKYSNGNTFISMIGSRDYQIDSNEGVVVVKKKKSVTNSP